VDYPRTLANSVIQETDYSQSGHGVHRRCAHGSGASGLVVRLAFCVRCGQPFVVCRSCDRGHVYCCSPCSGSGRQQSVRRARRRHRRSPEGRRDHADRERERRRRRRQADPGSGSGGEPSESVGDHGSAAIEVEVGPAAEPLGRVERSVEGQTTSQQETFDEAPAPYAAVEEHPSSLPEAQASILRCIVCGRVGRLVVDAWPARRPVRRPAAPRLPRGPGPGRRRRPGP
jgi:hypothetical protein